MVVAGIDTDGKGAIALLDCSERTLDVYRIPAEHVKKSTGRLRLQTRYCVLGTLLVELISHVDAAYLEKQWGWEGEAAGSSFQFGATYGDIRGATAASFAASGRDPKEHLHLVMAADWKHALHVGADKEKCRALATQLFPSCAHAWKKGKNPVSAAEASLIAFYGAALSGAVFAPGVVVGPRLQPYSKITRSLVCT